MTRKLFIIDGKNLFCRAFYIARALKENILRFVLRMILNLKDSFPDCRFIFCFDTCKSERRVKLFPEYKKNRKANLSEDEYILFCFIYDLFIKVIKNLNFMVLDGDGYEADDYIACLVYLTKHNYDITIVSMDMDILQLVDSNVRIYEPLKNIFINSDNFENVIGVSRKYYLDYKCIIGDSSDNIKGINGIGEKTAKRLVNEFGSFEKIIEVLKTKDKLSHREKLFLQGEQIFARNKVLMDLTLTYVDDKLKKLIREKTKQVFLDKENVYNILLQQECVEIYNELVEKCLKN